MAIPNRPFSGKPIKIILGKFPPDGDYREPLTESELYLLQQVVPGLSIRVVESKPELSDPQLELFLREYYHMGDSRISTLTWANIFDACKNYMATQKSEKAVHIESDIDQEIDSKTKEQTWRNEAHEYIPNADAVKMGDNIIKIATLSKLLRKPGYPIRWMRNGRRAKVHTQDFLKYIKNLKMVDNFNVSALEQAETKKIIDFQKRKTGK